MGIGRKLQGVLRDLAPLERQGEVEGFFNNSENAGKLGGLVEDIRDAMIEYQVRTASYPLVPYLTFVQDCAATRDLQQAARYRRKATRYRRQESPTHGEFHPFTFVLTD